MKFRTSCIMQGAKYYCVLLLFTVTKTEICIFPSSLLPPSYTISNFRFHFPVIIKMLMVYLKHMKLQTLNLYPHIKIYCDNYFRLFSSKMYLWLSTFSGFSVSSNHLLQSSFVFARPQCSQREYKSSYTPELDPVKLLIWS